MWPITTLYPYFYFLDNRYQKLMRYESVERIYLCKHITSKFGSNFGNQYADVIPGEIWVKLWNGAKLCH